MINSRTILKTAFVSLVLIGVSACTPEVGSPKWCKAMKEKPKGDWTVNESKDYLKHCLIKDDDN
ncbi:DUF3012 domain-containing protein [Aliikangiella sp. G2MR2-5]|uniref:DUF3012 domain-containing protein n=1 Tax=Aliikangiella sp. G2MR2-5 TaxID=2788943 RepID=UPI0018AAC2BB|nr:DUF3012 domain-containing protein [Aliikangiella sp. G2MR2-5]